MLIGDTLTYTVTGHRLADGDTSVTSEYARRLSAENPQIVVEWRCTNGHPSESRSYFRGAEAPDYARDERIALVAEERRLEGLAARHRARTR